MPQRLLVTIPTWNESGNVGLLIERLLALPVNGLEILVIDDDSPDGTAGIVRDFEDRDPRVHLLLRTTERGRGTAGVAGFQWGVERGYDLYFLEWSLLGAAFC